MRRLALSLALALPATSCAALSGAPQAGSYVSQNVMPADTPTVASAIATFVAMRQPPGPVTVDPPKAGDVVGLADLVASDLRAAGFVVSPAGRNHLSYDVESDDAELLLRVRLDDSRGARVLTRPAPGQPLTADGPFTVTLGAAR